MIKGWIFVLTSDPTILGVNGCWGFPKGKINEGEKMEDCAVREVLEETGLNIK